MSTFSEHLNSIINEHNLTLPYLANESGFTIALVSKIKTGKRLPDQEDKIIQLIKSLHCSIEQENQLVKEYRIAKIGQEKYLCIEETRKAFENILRYPPQLNVSNKASYKINDRQDIHGEENINTMIRFIIDEEIKQESGRLQMMIQPTFHFLNNYLVSAYSDKKMRQLEICNVIALSGGESAIHNRDNILITNSALKLASIFGIKYKVFYHYKNDFFTDLFPYCILSTDHALLIDASYTNALYFKDFDVLQLLKKMFEKILLKCSPLLDINENVREYLQMYERSFQNINHCVCGINISYIPCILPLVPQKTAMRTMNPDIKKDTYVVSFLNQYWSMVKYQKMTNVFYLDGLELFMNTGICYELPKNCHTPFSMEERIEILIKFLDWCDKGIITPILLKEGRLNVAPYLSLNIDNDSEIFFIWNMQEFQFRSCVLMENTIKSSLRDFAEYMKDSREDTYSPKESLEMIHEYAKKYIK